MQFPIGPRLGKCVPFRAGIPGCIFRKRLVWETISRFEPEFWDAVSPRGPIGKRYPGIRPDGGMRFPEGRRLGNCDLRSTGDGGELTILGGGRLLLQRNAGCEEVGVIVAAHSEWPIVDCLSVPLAI